MTLKPDIFRGKERKKRVPLLYSHDQCYQLYICMYIVLDRKLIQLKFFKNVVSGQTQKQIMYCVAGLEVNYFM